MSESASVIAAPPPSNVRKPPPRRRLVIAMIAIAVLLVLGIVAAPAIVRSMNTASTDDAFVNGHVTFVAPRIPGQVSRVLVDDNNRVRKGDLLVQLDKQPYQVQVDIAQAALNAAQSDFVVAQAQLHSVAG